MKKILFVCDLKYPQLWKDGLWAALQLLKNKYEIVTLNLYEDETLKRPARTDLFNGVDFILGWGAFGSPVDNYLQRVRATLDTPFGLCIGGTATPPHGASIYSVLFYETEWHKPFLHSHNRVIHAFGVNTDIYNRDAQRNRLFDRITVGSFSLWKRHELLLSKRGLRIAVGEIQKDNRAESYQILQTLLESGVMVMDMVEPEKLSQLYRASKLAYIPCSLHGGGERAVLEARACGIPVEVELDNPKLLELTKSPVWDHHYYAKQLEKGFKYASPE